MKEPSQASEPGKARSRLGVVIALSIVVALGALVAWRLKPPAGPSAPAPSVQAPPDAGAAPPQAPQPPTLRVTSDVAGAFVFVDRKYLGTTPLESRDIQVGSHRLQVSAEGYDGVTRSIEVAETGPTDVSVSFKTVVVATRVPVVHKHRFGSCDGTLVADVRGLRYETPNGDDAWTLPFGDLEKLSLDYQGKALEIKQRGSRTWKFTTRTSNADPLLVFQREVDHAKSRLARKPE